MFLTMSLHLSGLPSQRRVLALASNFHRWRRGCGLTLDRCCGLAWERGARRARCACCHSLCAPHHSYGSPGAAACTPRCCRSSGWWPCRAAPIGVRRRRGALTTTYLVSVVHPRASLRERLADGSTRRVVCSGINELDSHSFLRRFLCPPTLLAHGGDRRPFAFDGGDGCIKRRYLYTMPVGILPPLHTHTTRSSNAPLLAAAATFAAKLTGSATARRAAAAAALRGAWPKLSPLRRWRVPLLSRFCWAAEGGYLLPPQEGRQVSLGLPCRLCLCTCLRATACGRATCPAAGRTP